MKAFNYFQPTELCYGRGRINEVGEIVARYGRRCLLVTRPESGALAPLYARVKKSLAEAGVEVAHFDGVIPNPTADSITAGAAAAVEHEADVVLGLGGGSSMDSAKAIAVEIGSNFTENVPPNPQQTSCSFISLNSDLLWFIN